jgi:predicted aspartyl protease
LVSKVTYCKVPFRLVNIEGDGFHIVIPSRINGLKANMLIDTGASKTVFDLTRIKLFLKQEVANFDLHSHLSTGLGTNTMESHVTMIDTFSIGKFKVRKYQAVLLDLAHVNQSYELLGIKPIDGVIGSDLLVHLRAQINFLNHTLKIYPIPID